MNDKRIQALKRIASNAIESMIDAAFSAGMLAASKPGARKPKRIVVPMFPPTRRTLSQKGLKHHYTIRLNRLTGKIEGVRDDQRARWAAAFPGVDIDAAIRAVAAFYMKRDKTPANLAREIALTIGRVAAAKAKR